jgi:hypothetical protein
VDKSHTTRILPSKYSGCLVENPACSHVFEFGFSFVCSHPDHAEFRSPETDALTRAEDNERYNMLRRERRDKFTADLDEPSRKYFTLRTDFLGLPLTAIDPTPAVA